MCHYDMPTSCGSRATSELSQESSETTCRFWIGWLADLQDAGVRWQHDSGPLVALRLGWALRISRGGQVFVLTLRN